MPRAVFPPDEHDRLCSLLNCEILDTKAEVVYDDLTTLAAQLCETPVSLVSLVDSDRQWFKSTYGLDVRETHRDSAFCAHAILGRVPFIIEDATQDVRTSDNPLVTGSPHIRFYAGIPLVMKDGYALGTLCVIDTVPRKLSACQLRGLEALARQVVSQLELRRANLALQQKQIQLETVLHRLTEISRQVPGVVFQYERHPDGSSCFPYASEGIQEVWRLTPEEVRADASAVVELVHPEDRDRVEAGIEESAQQLTPWRDEYRVRFKDGQVRWLSGNATPGRQPEGGVLWHGFITDITDARQAGDEALLTRARMEAVVDASTHVCIIATDDQGLINVFNSGAEKMLGYTAEEMLGKQTPCRLLSPLEISDRSRQIHEQSGDDVHGFDVFAHEVQVHGHCEGDWTLIRRDGVHLVCRLAVTAISARPDNPRGFVLVATDLTDARRNEESLRLERERLEMALAGGELGTWDWNLQTGAEFWDARFAKLLGEDPDHLQMSIDGLLSRIHPDDISSIRQNIRWHIDAQTPVFDAEFRVRQKEGRWLWVQARGRLMEHDQNGWPLRMLGTIADISERKQSEEQLIAARVQADIANQSKSQFLANMSHEIRTPLTAILGYAELLAIPGVSRQQLAANIDTIKSAGNHLLTIINDILDLSRIEAGRMTLERLPMSPRAIAKEAFTLLRPAAEAKQLHLSMKSDGPIPAHIHSDPVRVRQILMNLIGNAIKFTESGHVQVIMRLKSPADASENHLIFEVTDTGPGMTDEQQRCLFEPFMQADASMTRRFGGTGLGLSICRRMAELLDGDVDISSQFGQGTTATVSIATGPLNGVLMQTMRDTVEEAGRSASVPKRPRSISGRVLLVDDNAINRLLFEAILKSAGATVELAENGQVAVDRITANQSCSYDGDPGFDLIIMDMQMPILDGFDATRILRQNGFDRPVLALTAHAMAEDRSRCMNAGCSDFVTKPVERHDLIAVVAEWIERSQSVAASEKSAILMLDDLAQPLATHERRPIPI